MSVREKKEKTRAPAVKALNTTRQPVRPFTELESIFKKSKYISQMWIYGNSFHTTLVAVVVPEFETVSAWCQHNGVTGDFAEAAQSEKVRLRRCWL